MAENKGNTIFLHHSDLSHPSPTLGEGDDAKNLTPPPADGAGSPSQ